MSDFITVFEITGGGSSNYVYSLLLGIILFVLGLVVLLLRRRSRKRWLERFYVPIFLLVFGFFLSLINASSLIAHNNITRDLMSAYKTRQYRIVEGEVHVLHEQPVGGHAKGDVIVIDGLTVIIDYFVHTPAYHQTISHGGVLKEGVYAKVYYYKRKILRIDIQNNDNYRETVLTSKHPSGRIEINERDFLRVTWKDFIWIACISAVGVLFVVRKIILAEHGYGIGLMDYGLDYKRFRSIAKNETSSTVRMLFAAINILIPLLFVSALVGIILTKLVFK